MLSALLLSRRSYPAVGWAPQLAHQRSSHLGPLVLEMTTLNLPAPRRIETELSHDVLNPARVPLSWANSPTLGTFSSPRMRRADIEVPNPAVDVDSWAGSACYPRGSFYPLSHGRSTTDRGITRPAFRPCSACPPRSQAPFCPCTRRVVTIHPEGTVGRLRYSLGGDRPSQTAHPPPSPARLTARGERGAPTRVVFHRRLRPP